MVTHSSILAWRISWMEKPGRLQSMGSQRVRHDWAIPLSFFLLSFPLYIENPKVKLLSCVQLFATPWTVAHQASPSMEFSRHKYREWVAISFSRGSSQPRDWTQVSCIAGRRFTIWATRESPEANLPIHKTKTMLCYAKSLQSCPTLCEPIDSSPPGSPVPGILQARTLEWVAISFSNAWKWKVKVKSLSCVRLLATPWTAAYQAPPSVGFSRQEYWSGVP